MSKNIKNYLFELRDKIGGHIIIVNYNQFKNIKDYENGYEKYNKGNILKMDFFELQDDCVILSTYYEGEVQKCKIKFSNIIRCTNDYDSIEGSRLKIFCNFNIVNIFQYEKFKK